VIDGLIVRVRQPRFGVVFATAVLALLMSAHWLPMIVPGAAVLGLALLRPHLATRAATWWAMGVAWWIAILVAQDHMEDHVHLFAAWLVALAVSLTLHPTPQEPREEGCATGEQDGTNGFVAQAAWQARVLIGVTFTAAVAWKLVFAQFVSGATLWVFMLVDGRFGPLAWAVGLSDDAVAEGRDGLRALLDGSIDVVALDAPSSVTGRIVAVAILTLLIEAVVAVSHLVGDSNRLARLRLPSIVVFAVATYAVVPVFLFAMLLAVLELTTARWRRGAMWIVPVMVFVSIARFVAIA
jgi:hypothetical protein